MKARITSQPIRAAVAIVIIAAAAWIFRAFLLTFLIEPIGWLLWAGWRLVASVDRGLIWLIVIVACSLLIIRLVPPDVVGREVDHSETSPPWNPGDRIAHWRTWAARSVTDASGTSALRLTLETMAAAVAAATRTPLPTPLDARNHGPRRQSAIARLGAQISRMLPDHRRRRDARRIADLLNWMESALEIKHE
jgi:hypothetical protein